MSMTVFSGVPQHLKPYRICEGEGVGAHEFKRARRGSQYLKRKHGYWELRLLLFKLVITVLNSFPAHVPCTPQTHCVMVRARYPIPNYRHIVRACCGRAQATHCASQERLGVSCDPSVARVETPQ